MKISFKVLLAGALAAVSALAAQAVEIIPNSVYRIKNNSGRFMSVSGSNAVTQPDNAADNKQEWLFIPNEAGDAFYLRNVSTGAYLKSPLATSQLWTLKFTSEPTADDMLMAFDELDGLIVFHPKTHASGYHFAHNDGSNNVVCWGSGSANSRWQLIHIDKTDAEMDAIYQNFTNIADEIASIPVYQQHLDALFADKACTTLLSKDNLGANPHYQALPLPLKAMIDKTVADDWSENSSWGEKTAEWKDTYARKYRVQLYEPYSEGSTAASMAGIQAYTNMNNPTGIVGDKGKLLYVMVNDPIPAGATLYMSEVPDAGMYNSTTSGTRLNQGLNIVVCNNDNSHFFIYYTVNTVSKPSGATRYQPVEANNLKNFSPIKIHIEGGRINGFFNYVGDTLYGADTDEDYRYVVERATHPMFDLLGKYVILHFFLEDTPNTPSEKVLQRCVKSSLDPESNPGANNVYDPAIIMKSWDDMCFAERILMGIQSDADIADEYNRGYYTSIVGDGFNCNGYLGDPGYHYDEYFNNRMMGITLQASGLYMNATSWRTAYAPGTVSAILTLFPEGSIWGPAHEYGHMNQTPMRIAGTTEESNNIFSNVALYFHPKGTTSRCDYPSNQLKNFNEGKTYLQHSTWGTTRMFWQLWCYYHATGHNTKFYPRLYELLRRYPLRRVTEQHDGKTYLYSKTDLLHFAKMCCIAAEEDLTNFFTAWGFFVPQDGYHIDDYDVYESFLSQEDIDEVLAEIKSFGFKPNNSIILIDDRPGNDRTSHGEFDKNRCGELGGFDAFISDRAPSGKFGYTVEGNTVTVNVEGEDGVGFLIFDSEGNLLGFSNSHTFDVTPETARMLLEGTAVCQAIGASNQTVDVTNTVLDGSVDEKRAMLQSIADSVWALLDYADETGTKVGYFYADDCSELREAYEEAIAALEQDNPSSTALTDAIMKLSDEYNSLRDNPDAVIPVLDGNAYVLTNRNYPKVMSSNGQVAISLPVEDAMSSFSSQWFLDKLADGKYALRNYADNRYLSVKGAYYTDCPLGETAQSFTLTDIAGMQGFYAFAPNGSTGWSLHMAGAGNIWQWTYASEASHWMLTRASTPEQINLRNRLAALIAKSEELLDRAGSTVPASPYEVSLDENSCFYSNAPYTASNNGDRFKTWGVIRDNNINTYFHSDYSGANSEDGLDHYIRIMAPGEETFRHINLHFTTRNSTGAAAQIKAYRIDASADGETWKAAIAVNSGITIGAAVTNYSGEVTVPKGTKYIRFVVTKSGGNAGGHPYFAISEIGVENRTDEYDCTPDSQYHSVAPIHMQNLAVELDNSRETLNDPTADENELQQQYDNLAAARETLDELMHGTTDLRDIMRDDIDADYYDMQGRRLSHPANGVYIKHQGNTSTKEVKTK